MQRPWSQCTAWKYRSFSQGSWQAFCLSAIMHELHGECLCGCVEGSELRSTQKQTCSVLLWCLLSCICFRLHASVAAVSLKSCNHGVYKALWWCPCVCLGCCVPLSYARMCRCTPLACAAQDDGHLTVTMFLLFHQCLVRFFLGSPQRHGVAAPRRRRRGDGRPRPRGDTASRGRGVAREKHVIAVLCVFQRACARRAASRGGLPAAGALQCHVVAFIALPSLLPRTAMPQQAVSARSRRTLRVKSVVHVRGC